MCALPACTILRAQPLPWHSFAGHDHILEYLHYRTKKSWQVQQGQGDNLRWWGVWG